VLKKWQYSELTQNSKQTYKPQVVSEQLSAINKPVKEITPNQVIPFIEDNFEDF
jgi:hypothetical protein